MPSSTVRLNQWAKGIEEPSVAIQLFLILFLQAEQDLNGTCSLRDFASFSDNHVRGVPVPRSMRDDKEIWGNRLEDVSCDVLSTNGILGNAFLVASHLKHNAEFSSLIEKDD